MHTAHCRTGIGHGGKQLETKDNYVLEGYIQRYRIRRTIIYRNDTEVENMKDNYISDKQGDNPVTASD